MKLNWKDTNITGYVTSVSWSGSAKQAARSVVFNVAYSPNDKNVKNLGIKLGDKITFYPGYPDDEKTKFIGMVTCRERRSEAGGTFVYRTGRNDSFTQIVGNLQNFAKQDA